MVARAVHTCEVKEDSWTWRVGYSVSTLWVSFPRARPTIWRRHCDLGVLLFKQILKLPTVTPYVAIIVVGEAIRVPLCIMIGNVAASLQPCVLDINFHGGHSLVLGLLVVWWSGPVWLGVE